MASCYWGLCKCPDHEPCTQHTGFNCGNWQGMPIQSLNQINNAVTRDAELALVSLDDDRNLLRDKRNQLEQQRNDIENERNGINTGLNGTSFTARRRTAQQIERAYRRVARLDTEMRQVVSDLDSINARGGSAGALIASLLIVPYTSALGYCSCYDAKRDRLNVIAAQTGHQQRKIAQLFLRRAGIRREIFNSLSLLPASNTVLRMLGTITFIAVVITFILFGIATAGYTLIAGLLLIALLVFTTLFNLIDIDDQIMAARQKVVRLNLAYYRMQSITTCQRTPLPEREDENAWYYEALSDDVIPSETE